MNSWASEVLVKPAVEDGVSDGGAHTDQVTRGKHLDHYRFILRKETLRYHEGKLWVFYRKYIWVKVDDESEDVQWRPGDEKGDCTHIEDQVCPFANGS